MLFHDPRKAEQARVRRDLAARDAARAWRREAQRLVLSSHDAWLMAPPLARHGFVLERQDEKQRHKQRRDAIRERADRVDQQARRRRGLST